MKHRITEELHFVIVFIGLVWSVFLVDLVLPTELSNFGLTPRRMTGLPGIVTMPFLHNGWDHILGNTVPLTVLLCLMAGSRANTYVAVPVIVIIGGILLWLCGRFATHVGASGLVYGLIVFLIVAGIREARLRAILIAVVVGLLYGTTLLTGVLPMSVEEGVSWDGHLFGGIGGGITAILLTGRNRTTAEDTAT